MGLSLPDKAAAFCREMADSNLAELFRRHNAEEMFSRATAALRDGRIDSALETDLDALDALVRRTEGHGLYSPAMRGYESWPGTGPGKGALWWACPDGRCAGRGRVRPGQQPPVCTATGQALEPEPFRE
ncbi:MAG TPA: hypothetical protein VNF47_10790 [Streptosporangiaceae bacterium]|nr:hypothetical protein [Streptosporangiaceae bacterium]